MRTLQLHFPDEALSTLDIVLKQTKEARVFRRAQAVREVVKGQRLQTVSDTLHFTYSALRKWVHRFASQGVQGLTDRPRSGAPAHPDLRPGVSPGAPRRARPAPARLQPFPVELPGTRYGPGSRDWSAPQP
jgi:Winged helix-turn helix